MFDKNYGKIQNPSAELSEDDLTLAKRYLQGAVHSFCKNNPNQPFSVRDLLGGENKDWHGTPLQVLYDYHFSITKADKKAKQRAAVDAGWLLKAVLHEEESRCFCQISGSRTKRYQKLIG